MAIAENAARKLLHGGAIARGVADVGGISFGLWDLVTGFFANIFGYLFAALAGVAHLLVLPLELLWQGLVTIVANAAGAISSGLEGLWQHVTGFFAGIFAALAGVPHLLVLPLEALCKWLATAAADAAGAISSGLDGLWQHVTGFVAGIFSALAGVPHLLVLPLEALCKWLATTAADAAGAISSGLDGLWQHVTGFFAGIFAALTGAAHQLVLPLEALWQWLVTSAADAAASISSGLDGMWQLVTGFFPGILSGISAALSGAAHELAQKFESLWQWLLTNVADAAGGISFHIDGLWQLVAGFFPKFFAHILAALAGAAHEIPHKLEEFWRWLKAAAVVAFPFVLGVAVVVLLVALVVFWGPALCAFAVGACPALVCAFCYLGNVVFYVAVSVGGALSCVLPPCAQCLHAVTMTAPGAGGWLISRAAFVANPALYFQILRAAGPVVAAAVYCTKAVAGLVAAPVAALFRVSVSAASSVQ